MFSLKTIFLSGAMLVIAASVVLVEAHQTTAYFRLFTFAMIFLMFVIATALSSNGLRSAMLMSAALSFGLVATEAICELREPSVGLSATANYEVDDAVLGWNNGPPGVYHARRVNPDNGKVIYDVDYTIDANHDRETKSSDVGGGTIFFGESLTFGDGLNDDDTLPQQFANLLDRKQKVVNLGVSGFSPSQVLRELQTGYKDRSIGPRPKAIVMLTGSFHVVRTACRESWTIPAPKYTIEEGQIFFKGACAEGAFRVVRNFLERTAAYRVLIKPINLKITHRDIETYIAIVAEIAKQAKAKYGIEAIVPYIGGPVSQPKNLQMQQAKLLPFWAYLEGTGYDDGKIIAELKSRGVKVIDVTLRDEAMSGKAIGIPGDGHPTAFANQRRAAMTLDAIQKLALDENWSEQGVK